MSLQINVIDRMNALNMMAQLRDVMAATDKILEIESRILKSKISTENARKYYNAAVEYYNDSFAKLAEMYSELKITKI